MPTLGLGQGLLPLVGYNYGARNRERVAELVLKAALAGVAWTGLCWMIIMLIPGRVTSAFNAEPAFLEQGVRAVRLYFMVVFTLGFQMVPGFFFQGIGKGLPAIILSSARHVVFLLPALILLPRLFGLNGLWISFPIADAPALLPSLFWVGFEFRTQGIRVRWQRSEFPRR